MPSPLSLTRSRILWLCLCFCPGVMLGCRNERVEIEHYPIRVLHVEFPDSVRAGVSDTLRVGVIGGFVGCDLETVGVERRADSLFVTGRVRCRVRYTNKWKTSDPTLDHPPVRDNPLWLSVAIPALEAGRYLLVADGLLDTLVSASSPGPRQTRIASRGSLFLPNNLPCPAGLGIYHADFTEWDAGYVSRVYEVMNPPQSVGFGISCEIHATVVGPATCDSTHALAALRVRSLRPTLIHQN